MTPREWAYWCASEKLDPGGGDTELASLVAAQITNMIASVAAGFGGQAIDEDALLPLDAFVPFRQHADRSAEKLDKSLRALEKLRGD